MIKGHEKRTQELNDQEIQIAEHLMIVFKMRNKYRPSGMIISELKRVFGIKIAPARLRKVIHYMRTDLCTDGYIVASGKGYLYTDNLGKLKDYKQSLDERINSQLEIWNELSRTMKRIRGRK